MKPVVAAMVLLLLSCQNAKYQIIEPKNKKAEPPYAIDPTPNPDVPNPDTPPTPNEPTPTPEPTPDVPNPDVPNVPNVPNVPYPVPGIPPIPMTPLMPVPHVVLKNGQVVVVSHIKVVFSCLDPNVAYWYKPCFGRYISCVCSICK